MVEPKNSIGHSMLGTCRIPVGIQDQVGRTPGKMWTEVGLGDFWRCFLWLCDPTALGICQQHRSWLLSSVIHIHQSMGSQTSKPFVTATVTTVSVPQNKQWEEKTHFKWWLSDKSSSAEFRRYGGNWWIEAAAGSNPLKYYKGNRLNTVLPGVRAWFD